MKGYTKIELTNVHTGEKEVVEKHNIITNNLVEMHKLYADIGQRAYKYYLMVEPLYEKGMGGIILFSNPLTEDADKFGTILTSVDDIIGCGFNGTNVTTDTKIGNKNLSESKILDNGYKYVWDFGTSQANGVIASVGLTHSDAGAISGQAYAKPTYMQYDSGSYTYDLSTIGYGIRMEISNVVNYNFKNNTFLSIQIIDSSTIMVVAYKLDTTTQYFISGTNTGQYKLSKISETSVNSPYQLSPQGNWLNGFDGYYYYIYITGNTLNVARISSSTFAFDTTYGLKSNTSIGQSIPSYSTTQIARYMCIANGYLYYSNYNSSARSYYIYKVNLSDLSKVIQIDHPLNEVNEIVSDGKNVYAGGQLFFADDSTVHYSYTGSANTANYDQTSFKFVGTLTSSQTDGMYIISEDRTRFVWIQFRPSYTDYKYSIFYFGYFMNNLCTINNLSSSVVKTADKTMKITYTITEGE